jgi:hypothetical protein
LLALALLTWIFSLVGAHFAVSSECRVRRP